MTKTNKYNGITFNDWLNQWFEIYKKPNLKPYSVRNIEQIIRLHTPSWLKEKRMLEITLFDIDKALSELPRSRTRSYTRQVWYSAFHQACKLGIIDKNVLINCDTVSYQIKKSKALTLSEQRDFMEKIQGNRLQWLMLFYLCTGVRRTEALSLTWSDIIEDEGLILIRGTKSENSYRYILLSDDIFSVLNEQRKQNEQDKGTIFEKSGNLVFNYSPSYVSRVFKTFCPNHHLHDLRHTFITRCAESGVNVKVTQQIVGHSTSSLTLDIYTHVMDEYKRKEAAKFRLFPEFHC